MVRGIGLINDTKEIENIVVKNINGTPILVKHLANVHESSLPRLGQVGRMEEDDVVQGIVVMRKGENPGEVIAALKEKNSGHTGKCVAGRCADCVVLRPRGPGRPGGTDGDA